MRSKPTPALRGADWVPEASANARRHGERRVEAIGSSARTSRNGIETDVAPDLSRVGASIVAPASRRVSSVDRALKTRARATAQARARARRGSTRRVPRGCSRASQPRHRRSVDACKRRRSASNGDVALAKHVGRIRGARETKSVVANARTSLRPRSSRGGIEETLPRWTRARTSSTEINVGAPVERFFRRSRAERRLVDFAVDAADWRQFVDDATRARAHRRRRTAVNRERVGLRPRDAPWTKYAATATANGATSFVAGPRARRSRRRRPPPSAAVGALEAMSATRGSAFAMSASSVTPRTARKNA